MQLHQLAPRRRLALAHQPGQRLRRGIGAEATTAALTRLMGKGEAQARRDLMELHGDAVEVDV